MAVLAGLRCRRIGVTAYRSTVTCTTVDTGCVTAPPRKRLAGSRPGYPLSCCVRSTPVQPVAGVDAHDPSWCYGRALVEPITREDRMHQSIGLRIFAATLITTAFVAAAPTAASAATTDTARPAAGAGSRPDVMTKPASIPVALPGAPRLAPQAATGTVCTAT